RRRWPAATTGAASWALGEAIRHEHPVWAVGCRQEPAAITSTEVRPPPMERAEVTGETSGRGAAAPPTAVLAEGDLPPREQFQDQVTIQMPAEGAYLSLLR